MTKNAIQKVTRWGWISLLSVVLLAWVTPIALNFIFGYDCQEMSDLIIGHPAQMGCSIDQDRHSAIDGFLAIRIAAWAHALWLVCVSYLLPIAGALGLADLGIAISKKAALSKAVAE